MSATAAPVASDRSDFRTVTVGGAKLGLATAVAVVAFLAAARLVPVSAGVRGGVEALIVLAAGLAVSFIPAQWTAARSTEGIAGAAAIGLVGTVVFSALDIAVLRPFKAYPWTWDAIGGGSTWWYLPIWWMLGTFLAWMGGIVTAAGTGTGAASGEATLPRRVLPVLAGTIIVAAVARLAGASVALPVVTGAAFTLVLAALALVALARKG
ncbi:MAG: hypothetical protein DMD60_11115 [Gemmatimonadetes bacterium]|nr:MAG: hypothetical protein DMD60_11115 [Gemmatimonadota bacterium]